MNIKVTTEERRLILNALQSHAAKLHDYADKSIKNLDLDTAKDLSKEAGRCYDLCRKIEAQVK